MSGGDKIGALILDFGTSKVRAVLIDLADGMPLAQSSQDYPKGKQESELPADGIWAAAQEVVAQTVAVANQMDSKIAALSFSWFGANLVAMDECGEAVYPIIVSYDDRAGAQAEKLVNIVPQHITEKVLRGGLNSQSIPAKILWLKEVEPEIYAKTKQVGSIQQYILGKMGFPHVWDRTMAATSQYYDVATDRWMASLATAAGAMHPRGNVCDSTEIIGRVNHVGKAALPGTIPLVIGGHDCVIAQLGQGVAPYGNGLLADTAGTYDLMGFFRKGHVETKLADCITAPVADNFSVMEGNPSGATLTRFMEEFYEDASVARLSHLFEAATFDGMRTLRLEDIDFEGSLPQSMKEKPRDEVFAALVEAITLKQRDCFRALEQAHGAPFKAMRIGGGGARSERWLQLKADLFGVPVERCRNLESSSVGGAVLAGAGIGMYRSCQEAVTAMCTADKVFTPRAEVTKAYDSWCVNV